MNMIDGQTSEWRLNPYDMCPSRVSDNPLRPLKTMAIIILDVTLLPVRTKSVVVMMEGGTRLRGVEVRRLMGARIVLWVLIEIEIRGVRAVVRGIMESIVGRIHLDILNV